MEQYSNTEVANLGATDGDTTTDDADLINVEPEYQPATFARIAEVAQQEAAMFRAKQIVVPMRTFDQARAELKELAPVVRGLLHEVELMDTNFFAHGDEERNGYRVQCPVVVAHFAVLALDVLNPQDDDGEAPPRPTAAQLQQQEAPPRPTARPAYNALQSAFRLWLETDWKRAQEEQSRAEEELSAIRHRVVSEYERLGMEPGFDFDLCAIDQETAQLFKRYLAANVVSDRETWRIDAISRARKGEEVSPAFTQWLYEDDDARTLHSAMLEEMRG